MRTLALILAAGALSFVGVSANESSIFGQEYTSIAIVAQSQSSGSIEYVAEVKLSAAQMLTVTAQIEDFKEQHLADLTIDHSPENIKDYDEKDITFDYRVSYEIKHTTSNTAYLNIKFDNYYSYIKFHGLALARVKDKKSLFFVEYTNKFNAYTKFFDTTGQSKKTADIIAAFIGHFDLAANPKPGYLYVLANSFRRTSTNADKVESEFGTYNYYFKVSDDLTSEVSIFDRRANTPIWYGLAVAATAVAMIAFYIVVKRLRSSAYPKEDESGRGRYPYPDSLH